jgi:hypothetical protein
MFGLKQSQNQITATSTQRAVDKMEEAIHKNYGETNFTNE